MGKVTRFKPWVGNVKLGLTTGGFTVINPKTYLRTTMSQEKLNGLAMISIENEYSDNYDDLIEVFASKDVRRNNFLGVGATFLFICCSLI